MSSSDTFVHTRCPLTVEGVQLNVAAIYRDGDLRPIIFLHGLGSTKEDYADIVLQPTFIGRPFLAYDAPGCGASQCDYPCDDTEVFFPEFIERTRHAPPYADALYSASLRHKVRAGAVRGIFQSIVNLSDKAGLMSKFLQLSCPHMFMYGEQNASLSYLSHIKSEGVRLAQIPACGHFPMYSNPIAMWSQTSDFHTSSRSG